MQRQLRAIAPLLLALSCAPLTAAPGQPARKDSASAVDTAKVISFIRQQYQATNQRQSALRKVDVDAAGYSTEGGQVTGYYQGSGLAKVVATFYGEGGLLLEEYYFAGPDLLFVFKEEKTYTEPLPNSEAKTATTKQDRFYFHNGRLLRWLGANTQQISPSSPEFVAAEKQILSDVTDYTAKLSVKAGKK